MAVLWQVVDRLPLLGQVGVFAAFGVGMMAVGAATELENVTGLDRRLWGGAGIVLWILR